MANKSEKALEAAKTAAKAARAGARKAVESAKESAGKARKMLRESKHRRKIEAAEVVAGAAAAGVAQGAGLGVTYGDIEIPGGLVGGAGLMVVGVAMDEPDLQAFGLGGVAYGVGRMAETYASSMINTYDEG